MREYNKTKVALLYGLIIDIDIVAVRDMKVNGERQTRTRMMLRYGIREYDIPSIKTKADSSPKLRPLSLLTLHAS